MRSLWGVMVAVVVTGCAHTAPVEVSSLSSAHFEARWKSAAANGAEAQAVLDRAEAFRAALVKLVGEGRVGSVKRTLRLEGDASPGQVPTVDPQSGEVLLYRYPGPQGGYEASLAHELVHAFRRELWTDASRQTDAFLFLEEALAELLATEAGFPSPFPFYGASPQVVGARWVRAGEALPIDALVRKHRALNFRCMAQAYGLRLSFMRFVRERVGLEPLVALAWADWPLTPERLEQALGAPLATLEGDWKTWVTEGVGADAEVRIEAYRASPIRFLPMCAPSVASEPPASR